MEITCTYCQEKFQRTEGRGKPSVRCAVCQHKERRLLAAERARALRSRIPSRPTAAACSGCGQSVRVPSRGPVPRCRSCIKEIARVRSAQQRASMTPRERSRKGFIGGLMSKYGLTLEEYAWKLHAQDFHCVLCDATDLHVDHCHATGKFRGLLCVKHNTSIGKLGDDVVGLRRALDYLESCV